ncbi:MAG TPA: glutamate--tRNA ligase [Candidatus Polarisedimenticolaceae bacterium]|nr:glutamate--tRNA ligase [Candidatus Polarisedimenticolaceae bacterium]
MTQPVRVRFAPSPTGAPHIGNIRSALFNYLFAKHHNGSFIIRIEDTDQQRLVPESVGQILESLKWLGMEPDEELVVQSERLDIYNEHANQLLEKGVLYKDYTTPEQLEALRAEARSAKQPFRFTHKHATLEPANPDQKPVLRFKVPGGADVVWHDAVWGEQRWQREVLEDYVAIKADGFPTYHFANVVDDHLMNISHVIRAAEWIPSTPKHVMLYEAFGWEPPVFAHLPQVLGADKAKLSKRHGAKAVLEYRDDGYLPETLFTYLASLGFNDGTTQETYTADELIKAFSFERVQSSPAVFDAERLNWMNGVYIRELKLDELYERSNGFWPESADKFDDSYRKQVLALVHERLKFLSELPMLTSFFFTEPNVDPQLFPKQFDEGERSELLSKVIATLEDSDFSDEDLEKRLRQLMEDNRLKTGVAFGIIRVAITGSTAAPGLFETLHTLGKEVSLGRLKHITEPRRIG